jgi:hypothetical protein
MFWNRNKIKKDMIRAINPTSKASLKMQCLLVSNGDIEKAEKLYDFMAKDMPDLPMFDPVPPTTMQQIKDGAANTMNWLKENKDDIMDWVGFLRGMFAKGGNEPTGGAPLPPING